MKHLLHTLILTLALAGIAGAAVPAVSYAATPSPDTGVFAVIKTGPSGATTDTCGGKPYTPVKTAINFGCKHQGNPIADALFAIIRVLSDGVGLVVISSIVYGGIQYAASEGDPQKTAMAVTRIRSSLIALLVFIFGYAILNYLIPAGFLH